MNKNVSIFYVATLLFGLIFIQPTWAKESIFTDFDGKPRTIEEFSGQDKWLVVLIWASDCHYCNQEASAYVDFNLKHAETDARVLGISMDGQAKKAAAEDFIKRHDVDFSNLLGEADKVAAWFEDLTGQSWIGTPSLLIYAPDGELRAQQVGAVPIDIIEQFIQREPAVSTPAAQTKDKDQNKEKTE